MAGTPCVLYCYIMLDLDYFFRLDACGHGFPQALLVAREFRLYHHSFNVCSLALHRSPQRRVSRAGVSTHFFWVSGV